MAELFESQAVRVDSVANLSPWHENGNISDTCLIGDGESKMIKFGGHDPLNEWLSSLAQVLRAMIEMIFENGSLVSPCSQVKALRLNPGSSPWASSSPMSALLPSDL